MEWGTLAGLTVKNNLDQQIQDAKYFDQQRRQNEVMNMQKAKMFSDDLEFQNGSNPYDDAIIKQENQRLVSDIGKYVTDNPDWTTNVYKASEVKRMKQSMKSTPAVLRSMAYKDAMAKFNADLSEVAKNPNKYDAEAYDAIQQQVENYHKYGNQYGEEAAKKEGARPLVYQKPQDLINVPDTLLKAGKNINNFNVKKGKDLGEYMTEPKPEEVKAIKDSIYQEHNRSIALQAKQLGLTTPQQIDKWLTDGIIAGFEPKYSPGDPNALWERGMRERELRAKEAKSSPMPSYTPFDDLFDKRKPAGNVPAELAYKTWGETPKIKVVGNSGQAVDLTGLKMNYDNRYVTDSKGRRYLSGYVNVPLDVAKQNGIWTGDDEDGGISASFLGKAVRRQKESKDGKGATFVKLDYMMPIDYNDGTARQLYNSHAQPAKLVEPLQYDSNLGNTKPLTVEQNGYTYTWNSEKNVYE
ncbi:MAG: hypothetical protein WC055_02260 [Melioribacteraceae bacterium]